MQLVHREAELIEVDVDIDQQVGGQGGGEHPLREAGRMRPSQAPNPGWMEEGCAVIHGVCRRLQSPSQRCSSHERGASRLFPGAPSTFLCCQVWEPLTQNRVNVFWGHRTEAKDPIPENCLDRILTIIWGVAPLGVHPEGKLGPAVGTPLLGQGLAGTLTVRPLAAISGRVRVAGVVRRFRALVSCSITASISCREGRGWLCFHPGPHASGNNRYGSSHSRPVATVPRTQQQGPVKRQVVGLQLGVGEGRTSALMSVRTGLIHCTRVPGAGSMGNGRSWEVSPRGTGFADRSTGNKGWLQKVREGFLEEAMDG